MGRRRVRVLLVDDECDFLQPMAHWLRKQGYSVLTVSSGIEAVRMIRESPPDILFLDTLMPEMDGPAVVKVVREFNNTLPIIMMSAYQKEEVVKQKVHFYGVFAFFDKSRDFAEAKALLEAALKTTSK